MSVAQYIQLTRRIKVGPSSSETIVFRSSTPYRHYQVWVKCGNVPGGSPNVDAQPLIGTEGNFINNGSATNITDDAPNMVFQVGQEEIRPATSGHAKHPDDLGPAPTILSAMMITNNDGAETVEVSVYMLATGTIGGA